MADGDRSLEGRGTDGDESGAPSSLKSPDSSINPAATQSALRSGPLSEERKREILGQLFFEGEDRRQYLWNFFTLLIISVIIAASGLLLDSTAVVIAAMLVAPLMVPILGAAAALVNLWARRFIEQFLLVAIGIIFAITLSAALPWVFGIPTEWLLPDEILARTRPGAPDLLVALAAGFAGSYILARNEAASAVAGVAIAVALVPPLSACGILIYLGMFELAADAFYLFVTNYAAIVFTACAVFVAKGLTPDFSDRLQKLQLGAGVLAAAGLVLVIGIPLVAETIRDVTKTRDLVRATQAVETWSQDIDAEVDVEIDRLVLDDDTLLVSFIINAPYERRGESNSELLPGDISIADLEALIAEKLGRDIAVEIQGQIQYYATAETSAGRDD